MSVAKFSSAPPPGPWLRKVLLSVSRQAERDIAGLAEHPSQTRIHALRVRMKKLRALLRLIEPGVSPVTMKALRKDIRALKQAFAMNRDQHVLNALLAELAGGDIAVCEEWVAHGCGDDPEQRLGPAELPELQAVAHAITRRLQTMRLRSLDWNDVIKAYADRYAKARKWGRNCERKSSVKRMHRWRTPVKDHYFQSLLLLRDRHHLRAARKLGSLLGKMHDLALLREHYRRGSHLRLSHATSRQMKNLRSRILRHARRMLALSPKKITDLARA